MRHKHDAMWCDDAQPRNRKSLQQMFIHASSTLPSPLHYNRVVLAHWLFFYFIHHSMIPGEYWV